MHASAYSFRPVVDKASVGQLAVLGEGATHIFDIGTRRAYELPCLVEFPAMHGPDSIGAEANCFPGELQPLLAGAVLCGEVSAHLIPIVSSLAVGLFI